MSDQPYLTIAEQGDSVLVTYTDPELELVTDSDLRDQIEASASLLAHRRADARERLLRRHVGTTALVFDGLGDRRRWWSPRRLTARWHARACRDLVDLSVGAARGGAS